jgi:hypothetical protein
MNTSQNNIEAAFKKDATVYSSIINEMKKIFDNCPCHGEVALRLIFRDSKLSRWIVNREDSHQT